MSIQDYRKNMVRLPFSLAVSNRCSLKRAMNENPSGKSTKYSKLVLMLIPHIGSKTPIVGKHSPDNCDIHSSFDTSRLNHLGPFRSGFRQSSKCPASTMTVIQNLRCLSHEIICWITDRISEIFWQCICVVII